MASAQSMGSLGAGKPTLASVRAGSRVDPPFVNLRRMTNLASSSPRDARTSRQGGSFDPTGGELAGEFVAAELRNRGVEPASFSVKGLPKVTEPTVAQHEPSDEEWEDPAPEGSDPDEV